MVVAVMIMVTVAAADCAAPDSEPGTVFMHMSSFVAP